MPANARAVRVHAMLVRARARPGSCPRPRCAWLMAPQRGDQGQDGRDQCDQRDSDGQQVGKPGPTRRITPAQGPLIGRPVEVTDHRDDRAEHDQRDAERMPPPADPVKRRQQLDDGQPAATSPRAVRIQARKVRSLAKVYRASGSPPVTGGAGGGAGLAGPLASVCVSSPALIMVLTRPGTATAVVLRIILCECRQPGPRGQLWIPAPSWEATASLTPMSWTGVR